MQKKFFLLCESDIFYSCDGVLWKHMDFADGGITVRKTEMARLTQLGGSFIELGNAVQQLELEQPQPEEEMAQQLYSKVYQQVCAFCHKKTWCWEEEQGYTVDALTAACNVLEDQGLGGETTFSTKFQGRCHRTGVLEVALFNQIENYQQQKRRYCQLDENRENIAQELIQLGEQMQLMRQSNNEDSHPQRLLVGYASSKKELVSGDSWGAQDLQDGRMVQILCDGMGSGELAMQQSKLAVQLLQTLLSGGLSMRLSLNIINTVLSFQYGGVRFSTMDIALWNLNSNKIELYKYGAAPSFVKNRKQVTAYHGDSLPVGILPRVEATQLEHEISAGDLLIMMSDGLYELHDEGFQWEKIIGCLPTTNPQLAAEYLLAIATSRQRSQQKRNKALYPDENLHRDDMTVVVSCLL